MAKLGGNVTAGEPFDKASMAGKPSFGWQVLEARRNLKRAKSTEIRRDGHWRMEETHP
jgi:hypothetical protein